MINLIDNFTRELMKAKVIKSDKTNDFISAIVNAQKQEKELSEKLQDFDYWKEWKNTDFKNINCKTDENN